MIFFSMLNPRDLINLIKSNYLKHNIIFHQFFWRAFQIVGKHTTTLSIYLISAKFLGPDDFGVLVYIFAVVNFLAIFSDFGISTASSKYTTEYNIIDKEKLKSILPSSLSLIIFLGLSIILFIFLFGEYFLKEYYIFLLILSPLIILGPSTSLLDGIYRGLKKFKLLSLISTIVGFFCVIFSFFLIKSYGLIGAIISQNLFYGLLLMVLLIMHKEITYNINKEVLKQIVLYSCIIGIGMVSHFFYTRVDILFLGYFNYFEQISQYEIIFRVIQLVGLPVLIISQVLAPYIIEDYSKNKYEKIKRKLTSYIFLIFIIGIVISILLFFSLPIVIKILLPNYFLPEFLFILKFILIIVPFEFSGIIVGTVFLISTNNAKILTYTVLIMGILNVILNFLLMSKFGFIGVIYATVICFILANSLLLILFYYKINRQISSCQISTIGMEVN